MNKHDPSAIKGGGGGGLNTTAATSASATSQEDTSVNTSMVSSSSSSLLSRYSLVSSSPPQHSPSQLQSQSRQLQPRPQPQRFQNQLERRQELFFAQIRLLLYVLFGSTILFLFFFLNLFAFVTLFMGISSFSMLGYTVYSYLIFLQEDAPDGILFHLLPPSLQNYLTTTSPHEAMTGGESTFLQNHWYWLYFIPGLTREQVDSLVERLPERQREMVYGRGGVARLILPEQVYRWIAPPLGSVVGVGGGSGSVSSSSLVERRRRTRTRRRERRRRTPMVVMRLTEENGERAVPLPVIEEYDDSMNGVDILEEDDEGDSAVVNDAEEEENNEIQEEQVLPQQQQQQHSITMQDAFLGILDNARYLMGTRTTAAAAREQQQDVDNVPRQQPMQRTIIEPYHDLSWDDEDDDKDGGQENHNQPQGDNIQVHEIQDSESETSDLGIDVGVNDFTGGMNEGQLSRLGQFLRLRPFSASDGAVVGSGSDGRRRRRTTTTATTTTIVESNHLVESHREDLPPRIVTMITTNNNDNDNNDNHNNMNSLQPPEEITGEDIFNQALSTMVDNYASSARDAIGDAMSNATLSFVESTSRSLIRAGTWLSSLSGVGLLGLYTASLQVSPSSSSSRILEMGGTRTTTTITSGANRRLGQGRTERYWMTGLLSTMAVGMVTVGGAYVARFLTRRYLGRNQRALTDKKEDVENR